jgi:hypothetical protein
MIVIASKYGRLGNQLFLFANFIGWAIEQGVRIANPAFEEYADFFEGTANDPWCRYPVRKSVSGPRFRRIALRAAAVGARLFGALDIGGSEYCSLRDSSLHLRRLAFVSGWLYRDSTALAQHAAAIRAYFTPKDPYPARIDKLMAEIRATCSVVVGVHLRRSDFRVQADGRCFFAPSDYRRLMERMAGLLEGQRIGFLVCSDEPIDKVDFVPLNVRCGLGHPIEDLYSLARCDYLIGPPSTFSMWASFYGAVPYFKFEDRCAAPRLSDFMVVRNA